MPSMHPKLKVKNEKKKNSNLPMTYSSSADIFRLFLVFLDKKIKFLKYSNFLSLGFQNSFMWILQISPITKDDRKREVMWGCGLQVHLAPMQIPRAAGATARMKEASVRAHAGKDAQIPCTGGQL